MGIAFVHFGGCSDRHHLGSRKTDIIPDRTLVLSFLSTEVWKQIFILYKLPSVRYCIKATQIIKYHPLPYTPYTY